MSSSSSTSATSNTSSSTQPQRPDVLASRGRSGSSSSVNSNSSDTQIRSGSLYTICPPVQAPGNSARRASSGSRNRISLLGRLKGQKVPEDVVADDMSEVASEIGTIHEIEEEEDAERRAEIEQMTIDEQAEVGNGGSNEDDDMGGRTARNSFDAGTARNSLNLERGGGPGQILISPPTDLPPNFKLHPQSSHEAGPSRYSEALDLGGLSLSSKGRKSRLRASEKKEYAAVSLHADDQDEEDDEEDEDADREWRPDEEIEDDDAMDVQPTTNNNDAERQKSYLCEWEGCGKAYTKPAKLKEHQLSHTGEVSFHPAPPSLVPLSFFTFRNSLFKKVSVQF